MHEMLAFDKAPPLAAPLRFFLTAPLFLALAGLLIAHSGAEVFASRWMPSALAVTHLVTIGFLLMTMLGALIQILPVVAGASVTHPMVVGSIVHAGLASGALSLSAAFLWGQAWLFIAAAALMGVALAVFLIATGAALRIVRTTSPTIGGLKMSLIGLAGVAVLGIWLALALAMARGWALPLVEMVNLHAGWAFSAWAGVLLAAVCYVVVPMFHLAPPYRARPSWAIPPLFLSGAALWAVGVASGRGDWGRIAEALLAALGIAFAAYTLWLQSQRRRARIDSPTRYWQAGLLSSCAALAMSVVAAVFPAVADWPFWTPLFGILLGVGGFASLIIGMLYRIVPFLVWLHLRETGHAPSVGKVLSESRMRRQMHAHFAALALLVIASWYPEWAARPAGVMLVVDGVWLFVNLWTAFKVYRGMRMAAAC